MSSPIDSVIDEHQEQGDLLYQTSWQVGSTYEVARTEEAPALRTLEGSESEEVLLRSAIREVGLTGRQESGLDVVFLESGLDVVSIAQADDDDFEDFGIVERDGVALRRVLRARLGY